MSLHFSLHANAAGVWNSGFPASSPSNVEGYSSQREWSGGDGGGFSEVFVFISVCFLPFFLSFFLRGPTPF